jgi:hypothetical protein
VTDSDSPQSTVGAQSAGVRKKARGRAAKGLPPSQAAKVIPTRVFARLTSGQQAIADRAAEQFAVNAAAHKNRPGVCMGILEALPAIAGLQPEDRASATMFQHDVTLVHLQVVQYVRELMGKAGPIPIRTGLELFARPATKALPLSEDDRLLLTGVLEQCLYLLNVPQHCPDLVLNSGVPMSTQARTSLRPHL